MTIALLVYSMFLPKLLECELDPTTLGDVFIASKEQLLMYVTYCQNKAASDTLYHEFTSFFEEVKAQLKDRLELPDYLIMPVQRITKYTLILHDFHKSRLVTLNIINRVVLVSAVNHTCMCGIVCHCNHKINENAKEFPYKVVEQCSTTLRLFKLL